MKLAHYNPWLEGRGGVPTYCRLLIDALARRGTAGAVICRAGALQTTEPSVPAYYPRSVVPLMLSDFATLARYLRSHRDSIDALVLYGGFSPFNAVAALMSRAYGVPYIVSPEGTVAPAAFTHGRKLLKRTYWPFVERQILSHAAAIRVLSDFEERCLRAYGIRTPMVVAAQGPASDSLQAFDTYSRTRVAARNFLFLGRLDVWQKGLDYLLEGFSASIRRDNKGQHLTLAGPPFLDALPQLRSQCSRLGLVEGRDVTIRSAVQGDAKWALFRSADVFIHPSRREGIPRAVLEALALGLPVIVTHETNLGTRVEQARAGWCVPATADGVTRGVSQALATDDLSLRGENAARLARSAFTWDGIADDFTQGVSAALDHRRG